MDMDDLGDICLFDLDIKKTIETIQSFLEEMENSFSRNNLSIMEKYVRDFLNISEEKNKECLAILKGEK